MLIYPDDRVLVAIVNDQKDWQRVLDEHWYRLPVKHAPSIVPNFDWLAFYFPAKFGSDRYAIHYYAKVAGHELVTRRDLIPAEADHKRAANWYYKIELGDIHHRLPPIVAETWRRITFLFTTGDRFEAAREIRDLQADYASDGRRFVTLKEHSSEFSADPAQPESAQADSKKQRSDGINRLAAELGH